MPALVAEDDTGKLHELVRLMNRPPRRHNPIPDTLWRECDCSVGCRTQLSGEVVLAPYGLKLRGDTLVRMPVIWAAENRGEQHTATGGHALGLP